MAARRPQGSSGLKIHNGANSSSSNSSNSVLNFKSSVTAGSSSSNNSNSAALQSKSMPSILARKRKSDVLEDENDMNLGNYLSENQPPAMGGSGFNQQQQPRSFGGLLASSNNPNIPQQQQQQPFKSVLTASQNQPLSSSSSSRVPLSQLQPSHLRLQPAQQQQQQQQQPSDPLKSFGKQLAINSSQKAKVRKLAPLPVRSLPAKVVTAASALPPSPKRLRLRAGWSEFREFISTTPCGPSRCPTPFPRLKWADSQEMWDLICKKEKGMYKRKTGAEILGQHPALQPRMRAILLDWLIEVCEVYRLHRETFYLSVDYIDRYLSVTKDTPKTRLQLIGVTCLFIAAKIEEIYPPKLTDFAYVTDGACAEEEILGMELVVIKALNWGLSPMTPNAWVKLFMQVSNCDQVGPRASEHFVTPQFDGGPFVRAMQLLDLAVLDMGVLSYKYSVLAASAVALFQGSDVAVGASGYSEGDLISCMKWLTAFHIALKEEGVPAQRTFHNVAAENMHNIQSHTTELTVLDRALEILEESSEEDEASGSEPEIVSSTISNNSEFNNGALLETPPVVAGDVMNVGTPTKGAAPLMGAGASVFMSPATPVSSRAAHLMTSSATAINGAVSARSPLAEIDIVLSD